MTPVARKAIVLAAGRGERMRPLTDTCPKPLLRVGGYPLIEYHLHSLADYGVREVVINQSYLGHQLPAALGRGERFGLQIAYSDEGPEPLEVGGGIHHALPLLGRESFIVINGDVWTDLPLDRLKLADDALADVVLVPNPPQHPRGDFALDPAGRVLDAEPRLTYSGIGVYRPELLEGATPGRFPLKPWLDRAIAAGRLAGQRYEGHWSDVGTPERLAQLDQSLAAGAVRHPVLPRRVG